MYYNLKLVRHETAVLLLVQSLPAISNGQAAIIANLPEKITELSCQVNDISEDASVKFLNEPFCHSVCALSFNARSIMNKFSYIQAEIRVLNLDSVRICETWVLDKNLTGSLVFYNYMPFADSRTGRRGGGVLLLINTKLQPCQVPCNKLIYACNQCNVVFASIGPTVRKTLVACVYRPLNITIAASQLLIHHLAQINEAADNRIILGDFNFPHIDWTNPRCTKRDGLGDIFQDALDDMGLFQCVTKPTYNNHILDLVLLSDLNC